MLIKFFAQGIGNGAGPVDYVTKLEGRDEAAPEVLRGDPDRTRDLIDSIDRKWRYTSGVISFAPEDHPSPEQQERLIDEFEASAFAGLEPDQYDCLWVRHQHTQGGRVELHFVTPRMELTSGKALNIAPPGWEGLFNPLRDAFNYEYGWSRPDDPDRARSISPPREAVGRMESREAIHPSHTDRIEAGVVYDRPSLIEALSEAGLETNRQGQDPVAESPFCACRTMMGPDNGRVYHLQAGISTAAVIQRFEDQLPQARLRPAPELAIDA